MLCPFSLNSPHSPTKHVLELIPFFSDRETTFQKVTELGTELEFEHSMPDFWVWASQILCPFYCFSVFAHTISSSRRSLPPSPVGDTYISWPSSNITSPLTPSLTFLAGNIHLLKTRSATVAVPPLRCSSKNKPHKNQKNNEVPAFRKMTFWWKKMNSWTQTHK